MLVCKEYTLSALILINKTIQLPSQKNVKQFNLIVLLLYICA